MPATDLTPLRLSNSKANTFKRCQKQYEFKYVNKLKPKEKGLPLFRGDWLHQLQMVHYDGQDWRQRHAALKAENWDNLLDEEKEELGGDLPEEAERLFKGYLAHYREEDKLYRVVDTEINETVELPNGMLLNIIIDMVWEEIATGGLWIMDHKWVGRFYPLDFMLIDSQLALYFWGADKKLGYRNLQGAILNESITKPPTLPKFLEPSQRFEKRKNLHCDAYTYYACVKRAGQDPKDYAAFLRFLRSRHGEWWRRTPLPRDPAMVNRITRELMDTGEDILRVTKRKRFTRTSRKECQYDCSFLDICMAQLQGASIDNIVKIKFEKSSRPDEEDLKRFWPSEHKLRRASG